MMGLVALLVAAVVVGIFAERARRQLRRELEGARRALAAGEAALGSATSLREAAEIDATLAREGAGARARKAEAAWCEAEVARQARDAALHEAEAARQAWDTALHEAEAERTARHVAQTELVLMRAAAEEQRRTAFEEARQAHAERDSFALEAHVLRAELSAVREQFGERRRRRIWRGRWLRRGWQQGPPRVGRLRRGGARLAGREARGRIVAADSWCCR